MIHAWDPLREFTFLSAVCRLLLAETWLAKLGGNIHTRPEYIIEVLYNEKNALEQVLRFCKDRNMAITDLQIHSMDSVEEADYAAEIHLRGSEEAGCLVARIQLMPGVVSATDIEKNSSTQSGPHRLHTGAALISKKRYSRYPSLAFTP